jgi:hypothetical protein
MQEERGSGIVNSGWNGKCISVLGNSELTRVYLEGLAAVLLRK